LTATGDLIVALDLPATSRVDQRVPKKLLLENGAPTAADKRHINEGIEELLWVAALKPAAAGAPAYRDEVRAYLEIAVLRLALRPNSKTSRLTELTHRAIPYPVILVSDGSEGPVLSAAHKRWSQGEAEKTVLDGDIVAAALNGLSPAHWSAFRDNLPLGRQPRSSLYAVYQGWIDVLHALNAARVTGTFAPAASAEHAAARRMALVECAALDAEIVRLRTAAARERQMARRVELNLELKRTEARRAAASAKL
jgi:hypothetical protein